MLKTFQTTTIWKTQKHYLTLLKSTSQPPSKPFMVRCASLCTPLSQCTFRDLKATGGNLKMDQILSELIFKLKKIIFGLFATMIMHILCYKGCIHTFQKLVLNWGDQIGIKFDWDLNLVLLLGQVTHFYRVTSNFWTTRFLDCRTANQINHQPVVLFLLSILR